MAKKRKVYGYDELSPAELAWLTGDESNVGERDELFLWCLRHGFASWYQGRPIDAEELLNKYGHLASSERRKYLRLELQRINRRPVIKDGKLEYLPGRHVYTRDGATSRQPFTTADVVPLTEGTI